MDLAFLLTALVVFVVGFILLILRTDRRRESQRPGTLSPPLPRGTPVEVFVDPATATRMAVAAIQHIGGRDVTVGADGSAVGWIGSAWTNIPSKAEYRISVSRSIQPDGSIVLGCACQPRFSSQIFGARENRRPHAAPDHRARGIGGGPDYIVDHPCPISPVRWLTVRVTPAENPQLPSNLPFKLSP